MAKIREDGRFHLPDPSFCRAIDDLPMKRWINAIEKKTDNSFEVKFINSSYGHNKQEVTESLKAGRSGITKSESFEEQGLRSQVWGNPTLQTKDHIDRKALRFMGDAAGLADRFHHVEIGNVEHA